MKIGVFDSGVGGLTVVKEIKKVIPCADIIYVGDSGNVPYGTKSKAELMIYVENIIRFLEIKKVDMIVFACNTATSLLLEDMKKRFSTPLIGVIEYGARMALRYAKKGIGVIATLNTIQSKGYEKEINAKDTLMNVHGIACLELVNVIESEIAKETFSFNKIERELSALPIHKIDTLILGCTHYPLIEEEIQQIIGSKIMIVNPAIEVAKEVMYRCPKHDYGSGTTLIYTSGSTLDFKEKVQFILGEQLEVQSFEHKEKASNLD